MFIQACILGIQDAFTAQIKAIKHVVCMCMRAWVEDLECACVLHLWYICLCVHAGVYFFPSLLCLWMSACVCLGVCIIWWVFEVCLLSLRWFTVFTICTHKHTPAHTEASCVTRPFTVSLFPFHIRAQGLWLESVSEETCPVHRKTTVFFLPLSLITFPPSLIFSLAPSHPLHSRLLSQIGWG